MVSQVSGGAARADQGGTATDVRNVPFGFQGPSIQVDDIISEGDKVFVLARMTGTHRGEFMEIPATENDIDINVCDYFRMDGGSVVEHWSVMDAAGMQHQHAAH